MQNLEALYDFENHLDTARQIYKENLPKPKDCLMAPEWVVSQKDKLEIIFKEQSQLYKDGKIVWAHLLQANSALFTKPLFGAFDAPAAIVYSTDEYFNDKPQELGAPARKLFSYKDTDKAPEDVKKLVGSITNEMDRLFNVKLPHSITDGRDIYYTSIFVIRKHLPKKKLSRLVKKQNKRKRTTRKFL